MSRPAALLALALALALAFAPAPARAALVAPQAPPGPVVELLRLQVPAAQRPAWQRAEQAVWEPWLRRQGGFLSREILWDEEREEALVLVHWASLSDWASIPEDAINRQQRRFERLAGVGPGGFPVLEVRALEPGAP